MKLLRGVQMTDADNARTEFKLMRVDFAFANIPRVSPLCQTTGLHVWCVQIACFSGGLQISCSNPFVWHRLCFCDVSLRVALHPGQVDEHVASQGSGLQSNCPILGVWLPREYVD